MRMTLIWYAQLWTRIQSSWKNVFEIIIALSAACFVTDLHASVKRWYQHSVCLTFINRCAFPVEIRRCTYSYAGNRDVKWVTQSDGYLSLNFSRFIINFHLQNFKNDLLSQRESNSIVKHSTAAEVDPKTPRSLFSTKRVNIFPTQNRKVRFLL